MKAIKMLLTACVFLFVSSCEKDTCGFGEEQTGIVGKWKLVAELMDPGDGSGTFQPVMSTKKITFFANGTFEANGDMCSITNQMSSNHTGTFDSATETFSPDNCTIMAPMIYYYTVNGNTLILSYPCICGCQQKFKRI